MLQTKQKIKLASLIILKCYFENIFLSETLMPLMKQRKLCMMYTVLPYTVVVRARVYVLLIFHLTNKQVYVARRPTDAVRWIGDKI